MRIQKLKWMSQNIFVGTPLLRCPLIGEKIDNKTGTFRAGFVQSDKKVPFSENACHSEERSDVGIRS